MRQPSERYPFLILPSAAYLLKNCLNNRDFLRQVYKTDTPRIISGQILPSEESKRSISLKNDTACLMDRRRMPTRNLLPKNGADCLHILLLPLISTHALFLFSVPLSTVAAIRSSLPARPPSFPNRIASPCFSMQNLPWQAKTAPLYFDPPKAMSYPNAPVQYYVIYIWPNSFRPDWQ